MRLLASLFAAAVLAAGLASSAGAEEVKKEGKVQVGKPAPNVELPATSISTVLPDKKDAKKLSIEDFKGKKNVVLFFFPKAMTSGCTAQCKGFRDLQKEFAKLDTVTVGISTDNLEDQVKFTKRDELNFPLFADADRDIAKTYGVLPEGGKYAKRVTFVIDKKGIVRKIYEVKNAGGNAKEVLQYIKENLADK